MSAAAVVYVGCLACWATDGYLVNGADTANFIFAGVVRTEADNTSGADGDISAELETSGVFKFNHSGLAITDVGRELFLVDNQTVGLPADVTNFVPVGVLEEWVSSSEVWVRIRPHARPKPTQFIIKVGGVASGVINVAGASNDFGGSDFYVSAVQAIQAYVTATGAGAAKTLLAATTDYTVAAGAITAVTNQSLNTLVITFTGYLL